MNEGQVFIGGMIGLGAGMIAMAIYALTQAVILVVRVLEYKQ